MKKFFIISFISFISLFGCTLVSNENDNFKTDGAVDNLKFLSVSGELKKTEYLTNEIFDASGITVVATYNDGSTEILNNYTTNFPTLSGGLNKEIIISYMGKSITLKKTINKASYNLTEKPRKLSDVYGSYNGKDSAYNRYYEFGDFPQTLNFDNVEISSVIASNGYYI